MKTPKLIIKGLVSGRVKLTPELLSAIKKNADRLTPEKDEAQSQSDSPVPEPPSASTVQPSPSPCGRQRRLIVISPLPGRWIRHC
jgi:hypothetical protein